ncbi:phage tail tape measure protein [Glaesserella parasuis]|nr:phage tail tape measure protein [Glaesserella parasuis]MWP91170.1 phage tail tape measure protein [Glaesserella parasuis]MWP93322.1 phage tail tape measure protein [Glaesserella parasuis]MWQ50922.1 phage tail tape measure protein [Glaesserella parasuis]
MMSSNLAISLVIGASVGGAVSALRGLKNELNILKDTALSTPAKLGALGSGIVKGFGGAISTTTAIGSSIMGIAQPAIQFESAMADVKKVVNFDTPEQFKEMEKDILELTRTIPMAGEEIAAIVAAGGQAGLARKHLLGFATDAAKMGVAFDMAAGDAGTAMATMANVLGKPISEMAKFGDAINYLSDNANSKAADIVNVITRAGSDTRMLGLSENQAAALGSTFLSMGKAPELAAQAIKGMTSAFAELKAGKHQEELKALGFTTKSFAAAMNKDAQGAITSFIEKVKKLPKDKQYPLLAKMFGKQYADDVMLLAQNTGEYNRQLQLLQETDKNGELKYLGSMQREFESRSSTTENNLQLLKNSFSEIGVTIGAKFLPLINNIVNDIKPVVYSVVEWIGKNEQLVNQVLLVGAGLATASVGFFALKGVLSSIAFVTFGAYKTFVGFFQIGWALVRVSTLLTLKVLDLGISFAKLFIKINLGIMKGFVSILKGTLSITFALGKALGGMLLNAVLGIGKAFLFLGRAMLASPIGALIAIGTVALLVYQYWEPIKGFFLNLWTTIKPYFDNFSQFVSNLWNGISGIWSSVWGGISNWFVGLWENLKSLFSGNFSALGNIILSFNPLALFTTIFTSVLNWFGIDLPAKFSNFGKNIIDGLVNGISNAWNLAKEKVSELGNGIKGWFAEKLGTHSPSRVFKGYGVNVVEGLVIGMDKAQPLATEASQHLSNAVTFEPVLNTVETMFKPTLSKEKGFFGSLWDDIQFGANMVGNLLGLNQPTDLRTPSFNPQAKDGGLFADYQPLNRNEVSNTATTHNQGITVHFSPNITISGSAPAPDLKEQLLQALNDPAMLYGLEQLLNRVNDQFGRRAY